MTASTRRPHPEIRNNEIAQRFEASVSGGLARADYRRQGNRLLIHHTEVPPESRNSGIAAALVGAALKFASDNGLQVVPMCSYVRSYMRRHPETQALLPPEMRARAGG